MRMKIKVTVIILTGLLTLGLLAFMGFRGFVNSIRNQRTCEWANIDNIELHAHIDIPKVTAWECDYDKESNTKRAFFAVDKNDFDGNRYIERSSLKKLSSTSEFEFSKFLNLQHESLNGSELYYKRSAAGEERYDVLLDKTNGRIWVTIMYND